MDTETWIFSYTGALVVFLWITRWGGAERMERLVLNDWLWRNRTAEQFKFLAWFSLLLITIWFFVGLFNPDLRGQRLFWWLRLY